MSEVYPANLKNRQGPKFHFGTKALKNHLLIIVATFNEMENLPGLVAQLNQQLPDASILVVDDDSPDGTGVWAQKRAKLNDRLDCLIRTTERGLGTATLAGMKWGLERGFDLIATMDADLSHPPESLAEMVVIMDSDPSVDIVVGSRYVPGGGIQGWPVMRRVGSHLVNLFVRLWLGLRIRDNSSAMRIYRAAALRDIGLEQVTSPGYAYLEELLLVFDRAGARIVEHAFVFCNREQGSSKLDFWVGLSVFREIFWMRFRRFPQTNFLVSKNER
jgi:dolichol-phosphate mannosyltransferase